MPPKSRYADLENLALSGPGAMQPPPAGSSTASVGTPTVRGIERYGRVRIAQAQLKAHGFDPGHAPTGTMTPETKTQLAAFQKAKGLSPTGTLDSRTSRALASAPRTAGRTVGNRRQYGGPVLVARPKGQANSAAGGGKHSRAGGGRAHEENRSQLAPSPSASGITPKAMTTPTGRPEIMKGQVEYESAGKRVPAIFSQQAVAAGATVSVVVQPQIQFRGENIVADPIVGGFFSLNQLQVGVTPQIAVGSGAIPFSVFSAQQNGALDYEMDLCDAGTQMTMQVTNNDTTAHNFVAAIWGHEIIQTSGS
jgi:peptidoglycan hydrolase-like protein with peptidoglycan-binding domain